MVTQKTKIKKKFTAAGVQTTVSALNAIDIRVGLMIDEMVKKAVDGNIKRLNGEAALLSMSQPAPVKQDAKPCHRCGSLPDFAINAAVELRATAEDYGKQLFQRWQRDIRGRRR